MEPCAFPREGTVVRGGAGIAFNKHDDVLFGNAAFNPRIMRASAYAAEPRRAIQLSERQRWRRRLRFTLCGEHNSLRNRDKQCFNSYPANPALAFGIDPATGGVCANVACTSDQAVEIYGGSPNYHDAYVYLYSMEIERRLPWSLIASAGYQGSVGHKLTRLVNQNFLQKPSNSWFAVYLPTSDINSNYNAMNLRLRRQFSNGFLFDTQYRYSKSIDQLSNEGPGAVTNQTDPAHPETEHGPSDFDAKHYLNFFTLYDLPFFRDKTHWTGRVLADGKSMES